MNRSGSKLSKIDRILVSHHYISKWPLAQLVALPREYSDQCPLLLNSSSEDFGPSPFKLYNSWISHKDFNDIVTTFWSNTIIQPNCNPTISLESKLKNLKIAIKVRRRSISASSPGCVTDLRTKLNNLDDKAEVNPLNPTEVEEGINILKDLRDLESITIKDLKQKSKIQWLREAKFYHGFINNRQKKARISVNEGRSSGILIDCQSLALLKSQDDQNTLCARVGLVNMAYFFFRTPNVLICAHVIRMFIRLEIREMGFYRTKEDDVAKISTSIYVTNFPESTNAKELFHACKAYGHVVDSFTPNKKAKNGGNKINKMGTINSEKVPSQSARTSGPSFASVLQDSVQPRPYISPSPAMVLDDSCIVERGVSECKPDLYGRLMGYDGVESIKIKKKLQHVGVSSWFHRVCNAQPDFVANERIVWVDIEGVHLHAWSHKTFTKICSKWGEMLELEESSDDFFARKRICIKTKLEDNIVEKFKIIIRGKIFVIRAKELFVWSPVFNEVKEAALCSDDESLNGEEVHKGENNMNFDSGSESDIEAIPDTCFGEVEGNLDGDNVVEQPVNEKEYSPDPFGIYGLMGKKDVGADISEDDKSIPYPPGFTPMNPKDDSIEQGSNGKEPSKSPNRSVCSRVVMDSHNTDAVLGCDERGSGCSQKKGGSVLVVLDDIIKIGKAMGYSMEGCEKDIEGIIRSHRVNDVPR
ncbi:hypothetical protein Tco_0629712 [Tanacetum coccineum]|uniref:DUF4283 domain-containing protein n=1 Tax=Tanacetum coccineum TaxID=301880 RepID=A0ABQ4WTY2_9ASTR